MKATPVRTGWIFAVLGFAGTCLWNGWAISQATNSTAAIGYFFLPFFAVKLAIPFFLFGFCLHQATADFTPPRRLARGFLCAAGALALAVPSLCWFGKGLVLTPVVRKVHAMSAGQIENLLKTSPWRDNKFVLGAALENPELDAATLAQIARLPSPELHERMGAIFPIMGKNTKGLAVMRLVAMHPNVDSQTLALLAKSPNEYVRGNVAANPKTPPEALVRLEKKGGYLTERGLACNSNADPEVLHRLAVSHDPYIRAGAAGNRGASAEDLKMLAKDLEPFVRDAVMVNPACPPELKKELWREFQERRGTHGR